MKTLLASLAVVACIAATALAMPRVGTPAYQYGLMGNDWWAAQNHLGAHAE